MFYKICLVDNEQNLFQLIFQDKMAEKQVLQEIYDDTMADLVLF